jgi:3',5'-cyclic AMP phosphodiesterase CpdA
VILNDIETSSAGGTAYRIAHISDTHVSPEYNRRNILKLKNLLAHALDERFDHIVITGDITAHGETRGYKSIRRLLKYFDLLNYDKLSVTVGNHDIFGGVHRAEDLLTFGRHCRTTDYNSKLRLFERAFKETFPKKAYFGESLFPFVKIVGPIALVGLNSIREFHPILNPVGSNGRVSDLQLHETKSILAHPSISQMKKMVLIHHHFNKYLPYSDSLGTALYQMFESQTLRLHRKGDVEKTFRDGGVDVVLHGHTHVEGVYARSGILYSSTALNPVKDKAGNEEPDGDDRLRFNEITVSDEGDIEVIKRRQPVHPKGSSSRALDMKHYGE